VEKPAQSGAKGNEEGRCKIIQYRFLRNKQQGRKLKEKATKKGNKRAGYWGRKRRRAHLPMRNHRLAVQWISNDVR
jgi:hypothetical protein